MYRNMKYSSSITEKKKTSIRFSTEAEQLLEKLEHSTGLKQSQVIELAIRELAKKWGLGLDLQSEPKPDGQ